MRLQARKMMGALLVVTLCTGWLLPAFAEESPGVFREAFSKIIKNYVEQPDPSYLALSAVNRMEEFLHANNKSITNIAIDDRAIGKDAKPAPIPPPIFRQKAPWMPFCTSSSVTSPS